MLKGFLTHLVIALLAVVGCSGDGGDDDGGDSSGDGAQVLRVLVADDVVASWTLAELEQAVAFTAVEVDGDTQNGPLLLDVLAVAGIDSWQTAEVLGKGEGRGFEVALEILVSDVDEGWVLDVSNRGTLKLAAAALPRQEWVRDVTEIRFP